MLAMSVLDTNGMLRRKGHGMRIRGTSMIGGKSCREKPRAVIDANIRKVGRAGHRECGILHNLRVFTNVRHESS